MLSSLRLAWLVPGLMAFLAAPATECGGPVLGGVQKIGKWGYSIRTIDGWKSMSPQPDEKFTVGKWKADVSEMQKRGDMNGWIIQQECELQVIRIPPKGTSAKDGEEGTENPVADKIKSSVFGRNHEKITNPKSAEDYVDGFFQDSSKRWTKKEVKAGTLVGSLLEFGANNLAVTVGTFVKEGTEWAIIYCTHEEGRKQFADVYVKSIQSLKLFAPDNASDAVAQAKDYTTLKGDDRRKAIKETVAGNPGWYAIDTKNYVFLSNSKDKGYIQGLSKEIETVRAKVYEKFFPPRNQEQTISPVRVLDTQEEYHQYGGPGGSAGYFSPKSGELVLFTKFSSVTKKNSKAYCRSVMFHEAFHQYIHYAIGDVSPHSWFNEGHGDYFAGMSVSGDKVSFGTFDWRVDFLKQHLGEKKDLIPLRSLVRFPQNEYYSNAGLKYSQGWAFIYWLRNVTNNKRYEQSLDLYFTYLADNVMAFKKAKKEKDDEDGKPSGGDEIPGLPGIKIESFEDSQKVEKILSEAVDKAFEGVDLEKMDKEFNAWVRSL